MNKCSYCEKDAMDSCVLCHSKICENHELEIGAIVICRRCLKRKLIPILSILLAIVIFVILAITFWPR